MTLDPAPKGLHKRVAGSERDEWNYRLVDLVVSTLPDHRSNEKADLEAISAMVEMKPSDPVEGILIGQIIAANEASMGAYRRAWAQPSEYLDARVKYLSIADKAARTVAVLTERLDRHRTQGQQQITVKHVTVNADQAVVADTVVTSPALSGPVASPQLLTTQSDQSLPNILGSELVSTKVDAKK